MIAIGEWLALAAAGSEPAPIKASAVPTAATPTPRCLSSA
jgi:hypothetical protein